MNIFKNIFNDYNDYNDYNKIILDKDELINTLISENEQLKNNNIIFKKENKYEIINTTVNDLKKYEIINWNKNRPYCNVRVKEIKKYYEENDIEIIPGIIYFWSNNNILYILDGLHRYTAAKKLNKNINIIININYTDNEQEIINEFININKSISIPTIYIENDSIKKIICESTVSKLCISYSQFISSSRNPHVYNFNRDKLIEFLSELKINFNNKDLLLSNKIYTQLMNLNKIAKRNVINGNIKHPKKCDKYNFFLFYLEKHFIKKEIEKEIGKEM